MVQTVNIQRVTMPILKQAFVADLWPIIHDYERVVTAMTNLSRYIWDQKYRLKNGDGMAIDDSVEATWNRVANSVAIAEQEADRGHWRNAFYKLLSERTFLPAGRILAGAGTDRHVTLFNCFVMGTIEDDLSSIFDNVKEAALTMQQGGGIGHDFSTIRPRGAKVHSVGSDASGPVSFMSVWDSMCRTIMSAGTRRGAMMGTLACDHPDIEEFIQVKSNSDKLRMFNLSVLVNEAFMTAVRNDLDWQLKFNGKNYKKLNARTLWDKIMRANYEYAEPGVIFIDRINHQNPLSYCEEISATNPCGEQPLPPYGACLLGSVNLPELVEHPFKESSELNEKRLEVVVKTAVRFLDNVIDISNYPLSAQWTEATSKRRIGLGLTGLADALAMCRLHYGTDQARKTAASWMQKISSVALKTSTELAAEKGSFPLFNCQSYLNSKIGKSLSEDLRTAIRTNGLRNGLTTSIAPTGTISLFAGNVSSGIEPIFDYSYNRQFLSSDGTQTEETVEDFAYRKFRKQHGQNADLPDYFVTSQNLKPEHHLLMQAALQPYVDSAISKTVNCPENIPFEEFKNLYLKADELGLKGCTTYRPNKITGSVLSTKSETKSPKTKLHPEKNVLAESPIEQRQLVDLGSDEFDNSGEIVYMSEPLEREEALSGRTYKLKWPDSDHAIYVTINDIVQDGRHRPFEIFINSKNMEHYAWTIALTRMISAVFRRGGDVSFVVEELQAIFDPRGGQWLNGQYVPSLLAAIGNIIERHMINIGFSPQKPEIVATDSATMLQKKYCPRCGIRGLIYQEGCLTCRNCGFSKCA